MTTPKQALDAIASEVWEALLERDPYTAASNGRKVTKFGRGDLAEAEATASAARERRARLDKIDVSNLDRTDRLTAAFLAHWLDVESEEPQRWWTNFCIAPYSGSVLSLLPPLLFSSVDLNDAGEAARYVKLAGEFADSIESMRQRVLAQAARGWRLPKPALPNARRMLAGVTPNVVATVLVAEDRPASTDTRAAIKEIVEQRLQPALVRLLESIGPDYEAAAPDAAGLMHQPGGADAYRTWIRFHLGFDADPADIHQTGLDEVARLAAEMQRVRVEHFGHNADEASFHERLQHDPKAKAPTPEALEATYRRHLERMAPVFARIVRTPPKAKPTV